MRVILKREDRINYVVSKLVMYYQCPSSKFAEYSRNPKTTQRKRFVIKVLRELADLGWKEVSSVIKTDTGNCYVHWDIITNQIDTDKEIKRQYDELVKFILET